MALDATLLASAGSTVLTALLKSGAALDQIAQVQAFVVSAVQLVEQSGKSGADKLTAVLNATETFVASALPQLKVDVSALSLQVRNFVNGIVSLFNAIGVFVKDVAADVKAAAGVIKQTLAPPAAGAGQATGAAPVSPPAPAV